MHRIPKQLCLLLAPLALGSCPSREQPGPRPTATKVTPPSAPASQKSHRSLQPAARQPGPARKEAPADVARAEKQAKEFIASLIAAKYSAREVTAMADIRGYTLYQQRYYGQAHAWFAQAVHTDPRYELSLFNAARTAALLGRKSEAKSYITALAKLETPLSRARMRLVKEQADFRDVR